MGIAKATFECEHCGKKRTVRFPTKDGRNGPRGWVSFVCGPFVIYLCGKDCRRDWQSVHSVGRILEEDPSSRESEEDIPPGLPSFLVDAIRSGRLKRVPLDDSSIRSSDRDIIEERLSAEFEVPKEIVPEFFAHLVDTACPRCGAGAEERCHVMEDDDSENCISHGPELKRMAHVERVSAAKISWKGKLQ